jgi:hypothetical protein
VSIYSFYSVNVDIAYLSVRSVESTYHGKRIISLNFEGFLLNRHLEHAHIYTNSLKSCLNVLITGIRTLSKALNQQI